MEMWNKSFIQYIESKDIALLWYCIFKILPDTQPFLLQFSKLARSLTIIVVLYKNRIFQLFKDWSSFLLCRIKSCKYKDNLILLKKRKFMQQFHRAVVFPVIQDSSDSHPSFNDLMLANIVIKSEKRGVGVGGVSDYNEATVSQLLKHGYISNRICLRWM